jgi:hypothetical protein
MQLFAVLTEMKPRDVMGDRLAGNRERQAEKTDKCDGAVKETEFTGVHGQLPADDHLKKVMDNRGEKADGGKDYATAPEVLHAGISSSCPSRNGMVTTDFIMLNPKL